jgi:ParB/RepB/Spo0J family partition protein
MGKLKALPGGNKPAPFLDRPNPEQFQMVPINELRESPHNPRKHFNQAKLQELADSIFETGYVITPLIVRQFGVSMQLGTPTPVYEIGAGHRRFRAAKMAGIEQLPVRILDLDDRAFRELLTIENVQREDVHPIEEADGYNELLYRNKLTIPELAAKVGKSEAYVRGRLELCDLIPVVRESFLQDNITIGHARLISRVPKDRQEDALKACFETWGDRGLIGVAHFRNSLRVMLKGRDLKGAAFDLADPTLKADAGACTACPKCSEPQRSLIGDLKGALCLDGACYSQKLNAHIQRGLSQGLVAISTAHHAPINADVLPPSKYVEVGPDQDALREVKEQIEETEAGEDVDPKERERELTMLREELASLEAESAGCEFSKPALIVEESYGGKIGTTTKICAEPTCPIHGERIQNQAVYGGGKGTADPKEEAAKAKRELERKADKLMRRRAWEAIQHGLAAPEADFYVLQIAAHNLIHMANNDFCKAFGLEVEKGQWAGEVVKQWLAKADQEDLIRFIVLAGLSRAGLNEFYNNDESEEWKIFERTADLFDVDLAKLRKQALAELKGKADKPAKKAAAKKTAKPAKADHKKAAANDVDDDKCDSCGGPLDRFNLCKVCDLEGDE